MGTAMWRGTTLLVTLILASEVSVNGFDTNYKISPQIVNRDQPYITTVSDEEYIRKIHSMFDTYQGNEGGRLVIETNALIDTKFRMWKRNADLINSLLALPKGMNDAGR